jgi:hypothetical protein
MRSLDFSVDLILPATLSPWGNFEVVYIYSLLILLPFKISPPSSPFKVPSAE